MHRRSAATLALVTALGAASLAACTPTGPNADLGEVIELRDDDFATVLEDADPHDVTVAMPDGDWVVPDVALVDELEVLGNRMIVPDGAAFVILGAAGAAPSAPDGTTFAVVTVTERVEVDLAYQAAVVVPDGGTNSTLVATYDGRDIAYDLTTGAPLEDTADPYLQAQGDVRIADWAVQVTGLPAGVELNDIAPLPLTLTLTLSTYVPELGWALNGTAWLTVESGVAGTTGIDVEGYPDGAGTATLRLARVEASTADATAVFIPPGASEPIGVADSVAIAHGDGDEPVELALDVQLVASGGLSADGGPVADGEAPPAQPFDAEIAGTADVVLEWRS